jgi:hypothetical protein
LIQDSLAVKILAGEFKEGDRIRVDAQHDESVFSRRATALDEGFEERTLH